MDLTTKKYQSISYISGPLLFVDNAKGLSYGSIVEIELPDGSKKGGQTIEVSSSTPSSRCSRRPGAWTWPRARSV